MTEDDPYLYPNSDVLRNRFGIHEAEELDRVERRLAGARALLFDVPEGDFGLSHLRSIHRHLFSDVYDWAGELRTVRMGKGDNSFMHPTRIETGMANIEDRLTKADFLRGLPADEFAKHAGVILGDVNHVHPFREGNGRTQMQYLLQLSEQAGHRLDLTRLDPARWIEASQAANIGRYELMGSEIGRFIVADAPSLAPEPRQAVIEEPSHPSWGPEL